MANNTPSAKPPFNKSQEKTLLDRLGKKVYEAIFGTEKGWVEKGIVDRLKIQSKSDMLKSVSKKKKKSSGGKVYSNQNKRYAHGGKVSGRKAKYNG